MNLLTAFLNFLKMAFPPKNDIDIPLEQAPEPIPTMAPIIEVPTPSEHLYKVAHDNLTPTHDVSPDDIAPDEYGCVESVFDILKIAFPKNPGVKFTVSTIELYDELKKSSAYAAAVGPGPGVLILCVSGSGNGAFYNGHVGVCGKQWIMSNDSSTGTWQANYTFEQWNDRYGRRGGFKNHFFKRIIN